MTADPKVAAPDAADVHADAPIVLSPLVQRLVLHWGEMGARWGMNRTVSQVHALLFLSPRPLDAEEIAEALQVARSNVSTSLRELASWKLVQVVHRIGDRRDRFQTLHDPWELCRTIVRERKAREFDPTAAMLDRCLADAAIADEPAVVRDRIRATRDLMLSLSSWSDDMLKLDKPLLTKLLKLGTRVQRLLAPRTTR